MDIPIASNLTEIYPQDMIEAQAERWHRLAAGFMERYGKQPDFVARSPGRVDIIGGHIDYSLYDVLPMAITADVLLAVGVSRSEKDTRRVRLSNMNPERFKAHEFLVSSSGSVHIDSSTLEWTNYFKAGLASATALLRRKGTDFSASGDLDVLVDGSVPIGSGLSSSAALTCASALAVLWGNGERVVNKKELVELAIVSERTVGVNSGGMDQAISVCSVRNNALQISFYPQLSTRSIALPHPPFRPTFVVTQTFIAAHNYINAPECYNLRVVEVTLAALTLAQACGVAPLPADASPLGVSLRGFHERYMQEWDAHNDCNAAPADFCEQLRHLRRVVDERLSHADGYTREQLAEWLGESVATLESRYMTKFPVRASRFKLRQRAQHVLTEALSVLRFVELLSTPASEESASSEALHSSLGALLNEVHSSCRYDYENSCPELEELCHLARASGAYGSRVTGAGWGGCAVHLVPDHALDHVKDAWIRGYYHKHFPDMSDERLAEAIVVVQPSNGSFILELQPVNKLL